MRRQRSLPLEPMYIRRDDMTADDQKLVRDAITCLERKYLAKRDVFTSPEATMSYVKLHLGGLPYEIFAAMWLDNRHRLICYEEIFRGTIDGASVHPREVCRKGLQHGAAAMIALHNHPSGVAEPSQADLRITERLRDALALVDIRLLDHLIVGEGEAVSFAKRGLLS